MSLSFFAYSVAPTFTWSIFTCKEPIGLPSRWRHWPGQRVLIAHEHSSGDLRFRGLRSLIPDASTHLFSTRIIAVSKGVRDFLTRWEAISPDLIEVVPNAVDEDLFQPATDEQRRAARSRFSLPVNAFMAGGMGRLAHEKNFILLAELAARHPDAYFAIAGSGPERERIAARADELGVKERVRLLGSVLDRPCFYQALDAFPSAVVVRRSTDGCARSDVFPSAGVVFAAGRHFRHHDRREGGAAG